MIPIQLRRESEPDYDLVAYEREPDVDELWAESFRPIPEIVIRRGEVGRMSALAGKILRNEKRRDERNLRSVGNQAAIDSGPVRTEGEDN